MPTLPYDVADAERVLRGAGFAHPEATAALFPVLTASHIIWDRLTSITPEQRAAFPPMSGGFANVLWRLLRVVDLAGPSAWEGVEGVVTDDEDDTEATLTDAMALLVAKGAVLPREVPAFAKALRDLDLPDMAQAVEATAHAA